MVNTSLIRVAICVFVMLAFVPMRAGAAITSVTVTGTSEYENAPGYTYAEVMIHGSVARADGSHGRYSVPAVMIYPTSGRGNRVGVVDWLNSAFYHFFPPTTEFGTFQFTLLTTGNYLFEEGYTYISIQWNKAVTEIFGPTVPFDGQSHNPLVYGSIERSADAWEILLDAARLLKDPRAYPGNGRPARVTTVLSSGYSQGGAAQLELLAEGLDPGGVYDGHLVQMIGLTCWKREDAAPALWFPGRLQRASNERETRARHRARIGVRHAGVPPGGSWLREKRVLHSQSRQSQLAPVRDGGDLSSARTNSAARSPEPERRRRQAHLPRRVRQLDQVDTREKPREASRRPLLPGERGRDGRLHPVDGCRWPFRGRGSTTSTSRRPSTAALPVLHSAVTRRSTLRGSTRSMPFVFLGGTFSRFSDDELLSRYTSRRQYVRRVMRAVNHLAARRLHLQQGPDGADRRCSTRAAAGVVTPSRVCVGQRETMARPGCHARSLAMRSDRWRCGGLRSGHVDASFDAALVEEFRRARQDTYDELTRDVECYSRRYQWVSASRWRSRMRYGVVVLVLLPATAVTAEQRQTRASNRAPPSRCSRLNSMTCKQGSRRGAADGDISGAAHGLTDQ